MTYYYIVNFSVLLESNLSKVENINNMVRLKLDQLRQPTSEMKFLVALAVAVACATADVSHILKSTEYTAPILKYNYDSHPEGHFEYNYETGNGIVVHSDGTVKNPNTENAALEIKGSVKYTAPDGTPVNFEYVANEGGFQPVGSHIPVGPAIPEHVLRGLKYIADHPPPVERIVKKI
ncbi:unnamed protein product [Euphydryas editha]|uniref:Larval cuticle protein LCP-17 n=1 Tax=Euphydryas editha TaxID=104508 RepID=A0AAU9UCA7_EUPED|nr:unnamed protein product [Euphydryas editha]